MGRRPQSTDELAASKRPLTPAVTLLFLALLAIGYVYVFGVGPVPPAPASDASARVTYFSAVMGGAITLAYTVVTARILRESAASVSVMRAQRDVMNLQLERMQGQIDAAERQRLDAQRPVVVAEIYSPESGYRDVSAHLTNIGAGPAVSVGLQLVIEPRVMTPNEHLGGGYEARFLAGLATGSRSLDPQKLEVPYAIEKPALPHGARAWLLCWYDDVFGRRWRTVTSLTWDRGHSRIVPSPATISLAENPADAWTLAEWTVAVGADGRVVPAAETEPAGT
jgi:hypothetical protein